MSQFKIWKSKHLVHLSIKSMIFFLMLLFFGLISTVSSLYIFHISKSSLLICIKINFSQLCRIAGQVHMLAETGNSHLHLCIWHLNLFPEIAVSALLLCKALSYDWDDSGTVPYRRPLNPHQVCKAVMLLIGRDTLAVLAKRSRRRARIRAIVTHVQASRRHCTTLVL